MIRSAPLLILALAAPLAGCALRPLYGGGESGIAGQALAGIAVQPIAGRNGWLMHNALSDRLRAGEGAPRYRLEVELDDDITGFGIRADNAVTRERRTLRARYRLVDAGSGQVLLDQTAGSDAGVDVVSSEYATIAAEQSALERLTDDVATQIVTRLAIYTKRASGPQP